MPKKTTVNPDLHNERLLGSFKAKALTPYIYGPTIAQKLQTLTKIINDNKAFDTSDLWYMSRQQRYLRACERGLEFVKICREHSLMDDEEAYEALELMCGEDFFINLHLTMFIPTIQNLGDSDQVRHWLPLAKDFRILGTYAQTELGHGSNVAGLQTTADLDLMTDEWIINTPTLESTKWWPGGLGKSCNYCVLMARLRIKDVDYGIHPFMLPIRCPESHKSLPGVVLFDIGQKLGYNGMDNGGMQLHAVRIPRDFLLQRYFRVDRQGNYSKIGNQKMLYATMTYTRKKMILGSGPSLARAVTIATRYSAVRRQFPRMDQIISQVEFLTRPNIPEGQVLDYSTQQYTIFPMISTAIGFICTGRLTDELYNKMIKAASSGDFSRLNELHILTSALKGAMTMLVIDGMEACRKSLGGHGYLLCAGLPLQYTSYVPQATYEGDFVVLSIQCGRGLLQMVQRQMSGKENAQSMDSTQRYVTEFDPFVTYTAPREFEESWFDDVNAIVEYFERRACVLIYSCARRMADLLASGVAPLIALDEEKIAFTRITKAHCHAIVLKAFRKYSDEAKSNTKIYTILIRLLRLYSVYWMESDFAEFIAANVIRSEHHPSLMTFMRSILKELRPDVVTIVDAFGFPDFMLNSVLGRFDGNVYEALFNSTKLEPLNQSDVSQGYYQSIQYILHPERNPNVSLLARL